MKKNYKHIIWDWNGTLLNDSKLSRSCINEILKDYNMPSLTDAEHQELFDFPILTYYKRLGFNLETEESIHNLNLKFSEYYKNNRNKGFELHKNAKEVLDLFKSQGLTQSILSAHNQDLLNYEIAHHQVKDYFYIVLGRDDISAGCKKALGQKKLENLVHLDRKHILYIGDTTHDFEVASDMGIDCILMDHGYQSRHRLDACGVEVLNSLQEIQNYVMDVELV